MEQQYVMRVLLFRVLLPLTLLAACVFRYNAISFIYLVLLLCTPLLSIPSRSSMRGMTGVFLTALIPISLLPIFGHIIFHVTLEFKEKDSNTTMFQACSADERLVRQIGFQRLSKGTVNGTVVTEEATVANIIRLIFTDVVVFLVAVITYTMCRRSIAHTYNISQRSNASDTNIAEGGTSGAQQARQQHVLVSNSMNSRSVMLSVILAVLQNLALAAAGTVSPSLFNSVYLLVFFIILTLWACYRTLGLAYGVVRAALLFYTSVHLHLLYLYQFQFFQDALDPKTLAARLLGLQGVIHTDCNKLHAIHLHDNLRWWDYLNPGFLLILYWIVAFITSARKGEKRKKKRLTASPSHRSMTSERQVEVEPLRSQVPEPWEDGPKRCIDSETGSMVFSGSSYGIDAADDDGAEDEMVEMEVMKRLVDSEVTPGSQYGGIEEMPDPGTSSQAVEEAERRAGKSDTEPSKRSAFASFLILVVKQSYVLSLIGMMAWSITYHSWLTFALLLAACFLWMMPSSRRWCLRSSPFILFYAEGLILAQYVFCMKLKKPEELPETARGYDLQEIGMKEFLDPFPNLLLQIFYTLLIVLSLRQFVKESMMEGGEAPPLGIVMTERDQTKSFLHRLLKQPSDILEIGVPFGGQSSSYDSNTTIFIGHFLWLLLCKYWIFFCTAMLAVISLQEVVIYRIIYMILFVLFLLAFQFHYALWRKCMYLFWWVVVAYSMVVLILIYTYQFKDSRQQWHDITGFSDKVLKDIGLERYNTTGLFVKLLTPTSFIIFIILQVRYFHTSFLKLSAVDRFSPAASTEAGANEEKVYAQNITEDEEDGLIGVTKKDGSLRNWTKHKILELAEWWQSLTILLWRVAEIHVFKVIVLAIIIVSTKEVAALTFVYVLLLSIFLPFVQARLILSHLVQLWTAIVILAKMIFQLNLVPTDYWMKVCKNDPRNLTSTNDVYSSANVTSIFANATYFDTNDTTTASVTTTTTPGTPTTTAAASSNGTMENNAVWFGLSKLDTTDMSLVYYERLYLLLMFLIAFESIIRYHQRQFYNHPYHQRPKSGIIFIHTTRLTADESVMQCIKFFANYFFYKFGLQCCFIMTAIIIAVRVDAISVIYITLMACFLVMKRVNCARLWPFYKLILAIMLPVQFLEVLGFPLGACIEYPWSEHLRRNLSIWLYLPDYNQPPMANKLIADTVQLLLVSLQSFAFYVESKPAKMQEYGGGDNKDILEDVENDTPNPVTDFTTEASSSMNNLKILVFEYMFWVTMAIVFITGVSRINIFSLFYVIAVFGFMWYGSEFFLKPLRTLLRMWNILIFYTILVMCMKAMLQLIGCIYINEVVDNSMCWLVQLFGINCLLSGHIPASSKGSCPVEKDDAGLNWDVVCFTFLLIQRRIYSSHYFRHVVDTMQAQNNLVSRGAEIINRIMIREVNKQNEAEAKVLDNIKDQMTALKIKQAKLRKDYKEPEEHFQAIRAGDYFLFDEDLSTEKDTDPTSLTFGTQKEEEAPPNPLQVINTANEQGAQEAIDQYDEFAGTEVDNMDEPKEPEPEPESIGKIRTFIYFLLTLWYSLIEWLIRLFNKMSSNYRLVARQLSIELVNEKRKILLSRKQKRADLKKLEETQQEPGTSDTVHLDMSMEDDTHDGPTNLTYAGSVVSLDRLEKMDDDEIEEEASSHKNLTNRLVKAISNLLVSRSEVLCYFLMILNQMIYGSLLSLPLPLMVFLWGMLSVPRPSKTFWVTVITYTEAIVVCKYLFQFGFFPWNDNVYEESPFFPPRIIGIEKRDNYANVDIALLLALFLHRSILRKYGLWRDSADISADLEAADKKEKRQTDGDESTVISENIESIEEDGTDDSSRSTSKLKQGVLYITSPFTTFFKNVTESSYNATVDVYAPMFCCDFILFLVLVFGFSSFGPAETAGGGDVASYIQDNKIPVPFLIMLITQFIFIVIDRALFLRKLVLGKFIFQILMVIAIHIWMFFLLPLITKRSFYMNIAAQIWYFIKCIYFGLSAYQIRCGYPNRILGNFLTKKYGYVNLFLFKGFLAIPFLLELRALMDWIWTDSTLAISSWLQMEDIYANIFVLKCWREIEKRYPTQRSIKKGTVPKYVVGGLLLVIIIFIIWFPLVFFSFFNSVFLSNPPTEMHFTLGMGGYQPLFKTTALNTNIRSLTGAEYSTLKNHYSKDRTAYAYLSGFEPSDVTLVELDGHSLGIWGISPISQKALIEDLSNNTLTSPLDLSVDVLFKREAEKAVTGELSALFTTNLRKPMYKKARNKLAQVIDGTSNQSVRFDLVFPRFLRLGSGSEASVVEELMRGPTGIQQSNVSLLLQRDSVNSLSEWWDMSEIISGSIFNMDSPTISTKPKAYFITFNDRKAPESLSFLSGYGVIGLYISFILLIGRLLRISTTNQYLTIMFRELPDVDKILTLCLDLYLVREMKDFQLEEDLYAKLVFVYRSPDTLVKFTRQTIRIGNIKQKED